MHDMGKRNAGSTKGDTASSIRESSRKAGEDRPPVPTKRTFTAEYKQEVLREVERLSASGERGAIGRFLRREGLYYQTIRRWREDRDKVERAALEPKKRGPKPTRNADSDEVVRLKRQVERLQGDLKKAEIIIDVQKKLSTLLGIQMPANPDEDETP